MRPLSELVSVTLKSGVFGGKKKQNIQWLSSGGLRMCEDALTVFLTSPSLYREEMKSLQAALQKQLDEANERAEKQQATVSQSSPDHKRPASF